MSHQLRYATAITILGFSLISGLASAADASTVLIQGPSVNVTMSDLTAELSNLPAADRGDFLLDVKRVNMTLERIYVTKELARQAVDLKLDESADVKAQLISAREKILAQARLEAYEKGLKLPDFAARAKEIYLSSKESYRIEPEAKVSHILIAPKNGDKSAALKKAQEIREQLASGKKTFEQAADEYSEDPSAKSNKGNIGLITPTRVVKPFADAAFALKVGEISQPVETRFGYHIIQVHEKKPGGYKTLDEVRDGLIAQLKSDYLTTQRNLFISELKGDKRVVANSAEIVKLNPKADVSPKNEGQKTNKQ